MNKRLISLMAAALALLSASGQLSFTGGSCNDYPPLLAPESTPDFKIYVIYDTQGVTMHYVSDTGERAKVCTFESYNDEIDGVRWNGYETTLTQVIPNTGYIINDTFRFWVVNYSDYLMELYDMFLDDDNPCDVSHFRVDGNVPKIPYSTYKGSTRYLDRQLKLYYNTLVWSDADSCWTNTPMEETFESLGEIMITPPLCNNDSITLSGDYYLRKWGLDTVSTNKYDYVPRAVSCMSKADQEIRDNENERDKSFEKGLGGSAPVNIVFTGYPTDYYIDDKTHGAVVYRVWEIATDPEFEDVIYQLNQDVLDYTFTECGTYYARYTVANDDGSCKAYSEEDYRTGENYTITVVESQLECPNIFSPGSTPDVNDVWRVSYKSLTDFHCWIFNRWGTLIYEYTDPDGGWDGKYHGNLVDTGVYYYVVTATGNCGEKYKRRGDINILRYKKGAAGTSTDIPSAGGY